jgi:Late competence development protein ComFB
MASRKQAAALMAVAAHLAGPDMTLNFEQVHNFYERLILEDVVRLAPEHPDFSADMLADVACIALNQLPARYVRHDVDLMFFLTEQDRQEILQSVAVALHYAFSFVAEGRSSGRQSF